MAFGLREGEVMKGFFGSRLIAAVLLLLPIVVNRPASAAPDPSLSTCEFPEILPEVKRQLRFDVVLQDGNGPIEGMVVNMHIVVESGSLVPGQTMDASAWSNLEGRAMLMFNGILGDATVHLVSDAGGVELCTSPSYRVFTGPKLALHVQPKSLPSCGSAPTYPCSAFNTSAALHSGYNVYLVIAQQDVSGIGVSDLIYGIQYGSGLGQVSWTTCMSALEWPTGDWPASGGGIGLSWGQCLRGTVVSDDEGMQSVAGSFYVYSYAEDLFEITPNLQYPYYPEAVFFDCTLEGHQLRFSDDQVGKVRFAQGGNLSGYNPCPGNAVVPPPPPPPPPPWGPDQVSILLHIGGVAGPGFACSSAPPSEQDVVTRANAASDGTARYYVYLHAAPSDSSATGQRGINGMQVGIDYDVDTPGHRGLFVNSWHACSELEFPGTGWPAPSTGNTITWSLGNCQTSPLVTAGYFYVTAYDASIMSVVGFPPTGVVKAADCGGAEFVLNQILSSSSVGWISMGGGHIGPDTDGCNPALEPCDQVTAVRPTTWGKLKQQFVH